MKESKANKTETIIDILLNFIYWLAIGLFIICFGMYITSGQTHYILPTTDNIKQIESILGRYPKNK